MTETVIASLNFSKKGPQPHLRLHVPVHSIEMPQGVWTSVDSLCVSGLCVYNESKVSKL